ncbi:MAG: UDP-3-O-(3-hydroxymyristoyl)glucosamine N-acyltransferase [Alphaproteobacteria bacterium]|nr:UDP-3-O-(3-hydroxymyristoyl)glucosamine N-acyltransferase [Alphaproteobacteria bacterium]
MVDTRFFPCAGPMAFGALCRAAGIALVDGDDRSAIVILGASEPATARHGDIALVASRKYAGEVAGGQASVYVTGKGLELELPAGSARLETDNPHMVFVRMLEALFPEVDRALALDVTRYARAPRLEDDVVIGAGAVFGPDVEIGAGTVIGPGAVVGRGVTIGRNCIVGASSSVQCAHLGDGVVIFAGARIGCDGFGWLDHGVTNTKIPQLGRVLIQDRVEIGANTTIDRGALGDTVIGEGTKIDNLVQIGHNCKIGRNCLIAAMSGIAGSTELGDSVLMGGNAGSSGHLRVGEGSVLYARAAVSKDWPARSKLAGAPARDIKDWTREIAALRRLAKGDKT